MVMEFDNIETIKRAVEIDAGVSLLPAPTVVREVQAGHVSSGAARDERVGSAAGHYSPSGERLRGYGAAFIEMLRSETQHVRCIPNSERQLKPTRHSSFGPFA